MVLALYSPSLLGMDKVEKMYENFLSKYQNEEKHPQDWTRGMTAKEKLEERRDRLLGVKRTYQLNVILLTQEKRLQPKKADKLDKEPLIDQIALPTGTKGMKTKRLKGMVQVARLNLTVKAYNSKVLELLRWKLATRGTKEFRQIYPICVTDKDFGERERKVPGYIDGVYLLDWTLIGKQAKTGVQEEPTEAKDPKISRKRANGDKVAIAFTYCSYQIDTKKPSFKDALHKGEHRASEPDKTKNAITREAILEVLGRTEDDIKGGLTIEEVLPFFQKYKLT